MNQSWRLGEGLVGQVALEGEYILLTELPENYHQIQSSIGYTAPKNLVIMPFFYEGKLCGVLELGSLHHFSVEHIHFLQQVMTDIGIAVDSAASRARMAELLLQSQMQTEEMQSQQEELRLTNEELSVRGKELQQQKKDIKNKNTILLNFDIQCQDSVPSVFNSDQQRLRQILTNLLF